MCEEVEEVCVLKQMPRSDGHTGEEWISLFGHCLATGAQQNHLLGEKRWRGGRKEEKITSPRLPPFPPKSSA